MYEVNDKMKQLEMEDATFTEFVIAVFIFCLMGLSIGYTWVWAIKFFSN
jgi:NhaP-type Na+/H+ or K+/H+ antiporter